MLAAAILITLRFMLCPSPVFAQTAQSFSPTGSMNTGRNAHRAIGLNDGTVLIAGGYDVNENALASAELYNLVTSGFTPTGSLNTARRNFGITLLDNGTVLVAGGYDANFNSLTSAEIYDPGTGTFTSTGSLNVARADLTATRLNDGTVLIAGGFDTGGNSLASAELYIPSTGTFVPTGSLNNARGFSTATALMDGTVLIAGGWAAAGGALASAEIYDPFTASFNNTGSLNAARVRNTATLLNGGNVLIVGGEDSASNILASAEIYSPATGAFTLTFSLNTARGDHAATLLTNGTVLVEGGFACDPSNCLASEVNMSPSAETYDPVVGSFSVTGSLAIARQVHTATLLLDGTILVAGGWSGNNSGLTSAEVYQPGTFAPGNLTSISISPLNPSLFVGTSQALVAIGTFSDNSTQTLASVIWNSSDSTVATVTNDSGSNSGIANDSTNSGVVFGVAAGTATVTACAGVVCGSTIVTVISPGGSQGFSMIGSPGSLTVAPGGTATFSLVLMPQGGFSQSVMLSCGGLPPGAQCAISPSQLTLSGAHNANTTVTITTHTSSTALFNSKTSPRGSFWARSGAAPASIWATGMFSVFPVSLGFWLIAMRKRRATSGALITIFLLFQLVACSGSNSRGGGAGGTPPGRYVIVVTGTSSGMSRGAQLNLIVK